MNLLLRTFMELRVFKVSNMKESSLNRNCGVASVREEQSTNADLSTDEGQTQQRSALKTLLRWQTNIIGSQGLT